MADDRRRRRRRNRGADVVGGWLLGHHLAQGHHGFPGDPLPGGHLGSPADLAFWGGVFGGDDEDDDPDDRDDPDDDDDDPDDTDDD